MVQLDFNKNTGNISNEAILKNDDILKFSHCNDSLILDASKARNIEQQQTDVPLSLPSPKETYMLNGVDSTDFYNSEEVLPAQVF